MDQYPLLPIKKFDWCCDFFTLSLFTFTTLTILLCIFVFALSIYVLFPRQKVNYYKFIVMS